MHSPRTPEEGIRLPETLVTVFMRSHVGAGKPNLVPLEEQPMLLATEPSLQHATMWILSIKVRFSGLVVSALTYYHNQGPTFLLEMDGGDSCKQKIYLSHWGGGGDQ